MNHSHKRLRGTGVALVTPFDSKGGVDFPALEKTIEHCIAGGVGFLVTLGTTGEVPTLSVEERHRIMDFTVKVNAGRLPVVAGFGGNDTRRVTNALRDYHFEGVDAILSSSPAYNKPSQEGIYRHYMALAEQAPRPIIIYNVPSRTSSNISADTTLRLAHASPRFIGIKEAAYDLAQASRVIKHKPQGFLVLSGDDTTALPLLSVGGDGVISVVGNALPTIFSDMIRLGLDGDFAAAAKLHLRLTDLHPWLYQDGNPAGIKAAMEMLGICQRHTRLPLVPVSAAVEEGLRNELTRIGAIAAGDALV